MLALINLASLETNRVAIRESNGIATIVSVLRGASTSGAEVVAGAQPNPLVEVRSTPRPVEVADSASAQNRTLV